MDYLLCGNPPYPAWKKHISVQNLSNRRIRRYLVCRLKRPEARDFSHVRFTRKQEFSLCRKTRRGAGNPKRNCLSFYTIMLCMTLHTAGRKIRMENFSVTFLIFSVTFLYDLWYTNPSALKTRIEYQMEEISKYEQKERRRPEIIQQGI